MSLGALEADVLVIGCGMGGMTAAYRAAKAGARVVAVDRAPHIGGTAVLSNGCLWTVASYEEMRKRCPAGDPDLGRVFVQRFPQTQALIRRSGTTFSEPVQVMYGSGHIIDVADFIARSAGTVSAAGGWVLARKRVEHLIVEPSGVVGARVRDDEGGVEVRAPHTILATGGSQGNSAHMHEAFGLSSRQLLLRSNPYSTGEGARLAEEVGGASAGDTDTFYGHLMAWPTRQFTPSEFSRLSMSFSIRGVVVNTDGRRFVDESIGDHFTAQATARQPMARALVIFDDAIRRRWAATPTVKGLEQVDKFREASAAGANVVSATTLEDLAAAVSAWGFDGRTLLDTVSAFNGSLAAGGRPGAVPRAANRDPIRRAPFHAIEVRPGVTFTQSGVKIDPKARVCTPDAGVITGLYATGADVGQVFNGGYAGGLALAAVFGDIAAETAGF